MLQIILQIIFHVSVMIMTVDTDVCYRLYFMLVL